MKLAAVLLTLATIAGCSASGTEPVTGTESAINAGRAGLCTPPTTLYRLTKPNADYYDVFASDDDARASVAPILAANGMALANVATPAAAQAIVARQFAAYQKLFPEHTAGLAEPPRVLLVDNPAPGAFATTDPRKDKFFPWVFFIQTGLLDAPEVVGNPGVLESTIAHELAHLILKNVLARDSYVFYRVSGAESGERGFQQANDPTIASAYATYQASAARTGQLYVRALGNFPFHIGSRPDPTYASYLKLIAQAMLTAGVAPPAACALGDDEATQLQATIDRDLDKSNITLPLGDDDVATALLAASWEAHTTACLASVTGSLGDLVASARASLAAESASTAELDGILPELDASDRAIDARDPALPAVNRLFALTAARRSAMAAIVDAQDPTYASLRFFTEEEEADDASVRIGLATGGKIDMILNPYRPTYRAECQALLAAGKAPEYGGFVDAHHGLCWRYQHVTELATSLATCN